MSIYLGKNKVGITKYENLDLGLTEQEEKLELLGVKVDDLPVYEPITDELEEQANMVADIESQVNSLKDISNETLNITENGEYDVGKYSNAVVNVHNIKLPEDISVGFGNAEVYYVPITENKTAIYSSNSNGGLWMYNSLDNSFTIVLEKSNGIRVLSTHVIDNYWYITSAYSGGRGTHRYNIDTGEVVQISSEYGNGLDNIYKLRDGRILFTTGSSTYGVYIYNSADNSFVKISSSGTDYIHIEQVSDTKVLLGKQSSGNLFVADLTNNSVDYLVKEDGSQLILRNPGWEKISDTEYLIGGRTWNGASDTTGIYIYNINSLTVETVTTAYSGCGYMKRVKDKCLIASYTGGGFMVYNINTRGLSEVLLAVNYIDTMTLIGDDRVICSSTSSAATSTIYIYYYDTDTVVNKYSSGRQWIFHYVIGKKVLIAGYSSSGNGILLYDYDLDTITKIFNYGYYYNKIEKDGNIVYLSSMDYPKYKVRCNIEDNTARVTDVHVK